MPSPLHLAVAAATVACGLALAPFAHAQTVPASFPTTAPYQQPSPANVAPQPTTAPQSPIDATLQSKIDLLRHRLAQLKESF